VRNFASGIARTGCTVLAEVNNNLIMSKAKMNKKKTNKSQAENISGRRGEILRTERRNSPDGAENGSAAVAAEC
jgi:hypothetical protein